MRTTTGPIGDGTAPATPQPRDFKPTRVLEVEIGRPLSPLTALDPRTNRSYERALVLVRLHTRPIGIVDVGLGPDGLGEDALARAIWHSLKTEINEHVGRDGLPAVSGLDAAGVPTVAQPRCLEERERFLVDAPPASVVVATRDRPVSLATCLRSLMALEYPNYEVIVVDNAPRTNATADLVRQTYGDSSRVRYAREDRPGLASAHNRGLREVRADSEIVAFTDDDVVADAHWLTELAKAFRAAPDVGCVTGMIFPAELETPAQVWIEQFGGFNKGFHRLVFDMKENRPNDPLYPYAPGRFGSGANMAFLTSVLQQMGGFDPAIGTGTAAQGGDDLAAFFEVIFRGHTLVYEPAAVVHHTHHREYAALRRQVYGYGVGLAAYLTKSVIDHPELLLDVARRVPQGVAYALSPRSRKNVKKRADYPPELTRIERKGMLYGPVAYVRSRWQARQWGQVPTAPERAARVPGPGAG